MSFDSPSQTSCAPGHGSFPGVVHTGGDSTPAAGLMSRDPMFALFSMMFFGSPGILDTALNQHCPASSLMLLRRP